MVEAPERIRVAQDAEGFWTCREAISGSQEYLRADIAERQIAELRAERDKANAWAKEQHAAADRYAARVAAAEAENARLKALPLKDGVERVLEPLDSVHVTEDGWCKWTEVANAIDEAHRRLSRLRAGEQEGWRPIETAPKDGTAVWIAGDGFDGIGYCEAADWLHDEDRWYLKSFVSRKAVDQPLDGVYGTNRRVEPLYWIPLPAAPSEQGGDRG